MRGAHEGGVTPARLQPASALPPGTRVQEFEIRSVIGEGGFGIVYRAFDTSLGREVAIKEYLPVCHALRREDGAVVSRSERDSQLFHKGLRCFVAEARMLARFKHPALVEVLRFWEDNGTAYMSMPLYRGHNLREMVHDGFRLRDERQLMEFLCPLLEGLALLHDAECFHRDISTDNIMMLDSGQPVLLDFGAARTLLTGEADASTVILKPGFAPIEQYSNDRSLAPQGAWSDIYALCAVVYHLISGKMPLISIARVMRDPLVPLQSMAPAGFRASVLAAIDRGLAVDPQQRPRNIAAFDALLRADAPVTPPPRAATADTPAMLRLVTPAAPVPPAVAPAAAPAPVAPTAQALDMPATAEATEVSDDPVPPDEPPPFARRTGLARFALPLALAGLAAAGLVVAALTLTGSDRDAPPDDIAAAVALPPQPRHEPLSTGAGTMPFGFVPGAPATTPEPVTSADAGGAVDAGASSEAIQDADAPRAGPSDAYAASAPPPMSMEPTAPPGGASAPLASPMPVDNVPLATSDNTAGTYGAPPPSGSPPGAGVAPPDTAASANGQAAVQDPPAPTPVADHGEIEVSVRPWGNVYLNGNLIGIVPPRVRMHAPIGLNEIEIRNETHPPHRVSLTVEPGGVHRINHDFLRE